MLKLGKLGLLLVVAAMQMVGAPIIGTLNIVGDVQVTAPGGVGSIDFIPPVGGGFGDFLVSTLLSQDGDFIPLATTPGEIKDLNQTDHPVGSSFLLSDFIIFDADADIVFDLTFINPGSFSAAQCLDVAAAGQTCTPAGSPFNLSNQTANQSIASFSVLGNARRVSTGELTPFVMTFSTQFSDQSFQELLATITTGGTVDASFSAEALVIPEPGTVSLFVTGGMLLAFVSYMRRKRSV